jgi:hypothetical protein
MIDTQLRALKFILEAMLKPVFSPRRFTTSAGRRE